MQYACFSIICVYIQDFTNLTTERLQNYIVVLTAIEENLAEYLCIRRDLENVKFQFNHKTVILNNSCIVLCNEQKLVVLFKNLNRKIQSSTLIFVMIRSDDILEVDFHYREEGQVIFGADRLNVGIGRYNNL